MKLFDLAKETGAECDISESRMWRVVIASIVLAFASLVLSEYFVRRGRQHELA